MPSAGGTNAAVFNWNKHSSVNFLAVYANAMVEFKSGIYRTSGNAYA